MGACLGVTFFLHLFLRACARQIFYDTLQLALPALHAYGMDKNRGLKLFTSNAVENRDESHLPCVFGSAKLKRGTILNLEA